MGQAEVAAVDRLVESNRTSETCVQANIISIHARTPGYRISGQSALLFGLVFREHFRRLIVCHETVTFAVNERSARTLLMQCRRSTWKEM